MAAVDYFLKIDGIDGESADSKHPNEIELESWSWNVNNVAASHMGAGGRAAGRAQVGDIHFSMKINKASPKLALACCTGQHFNKAVLIARKAGKEQQEYLKFTFQHVMVTSYSTNGHGGDDLVPLDQFSLNFAHVEEEYKPQKVDGTLGAPISMNYDCMTQKSK